MTCPIQPCRQRYCSVRKPRHTAAGSLADKLASLVVRQLARMPRSSLCGRTHARAQGPACMPTMGHVHGSIAEWECLWVEGWAAIRKLAAKKVPCTAIAACLQQPKPAATHPLSAWSASCSVFPNASVACACTRSVAPKSSAQTAARMSSMRLVADHDSHEGGRAASRSALLPSQYTAHACVPAGGQGTDGKKGTPQNAPPCNSNCARPSHTPCCLARCNHRHKCAGIAHPGKCSGRYRCHVQHVHGSAGPGAGSKTCGTKRAGHSIPHKQSMR